jgi:hypothetical protein
MADDRQDPAGETPPAAPLAPDEIPGSPQGPGETSHWTTAASAPLPADNTGTAEATVRARLAEHALGNELEAGEWPNPARWPEPPTPPHAPWPPQGIWSQPAPLPGAWPGAGPWPQPDAWRAQPQASGSWPPVAGQWQRPFAPARPAAAPAWPAAGYGALLPAWFPSPISWALGSVPWGFTNPPAVSPVLEAPGGFHPPVPRRRLITMDGRASPRLYAFGLIAGLPGIAALLLILVGLGSGFKLPGGAIPRWLILEAACVVAAAGLVGWAVAQGRQRRADGWRDYAGPSPFLMIGALLAIVTAFQIPLEAALDSAKVDFDSGLATALLVGMFLATYASLVHFLVVRPGSLTWHDIARPRRLAPSTDDWATGDPIPGWSRRAGETVAAWRLRISSGRIGDLLMPVAMVLPLVIASTLLSAGMLLSSA